MTTPSDPSRFREVPPSKLRPPADDIRLERKFSRRMIADIKRRGIRNPVRVRPLPDDFFEVISGWSRVMIGIEAELKAIPILIQLEPMTPAEVILDNLLDNALRSPLSFVETITVYAELMTTHGYTQAQLAEALGVNEAQISRPMGTFRRVPKDLHATIGVKEGQVHPATAAAISRAKDAEGKPDHAKMREMFGRAMAGRLKRDRAEEEIKRHNKHDRRRRRKPLKASLSDGVTVLIPPDADYEAVEAAMKGFLSRLRKGQKIDDQGEEGPFLLPKRDDEEDGDAGAVPAVLISPKPTAPSQAAAPRQTGT